VKTTETLLGFVVTNRDPGVGVVRGGCPVVTGSDATRGFLAFTFRTVGSERTEIGTFGLAGFAS